MKIHSRRGSTLLFAIVAMTAISVLGTGIYFMTTTAAFSGLSANDRNRAHELAMAGKDYALAINLPPTGGRDFTVSGGDKINLVISGDTIASTGIVREGTPFETRKRITVTTSGFSSQADISLTKDIAAMGIIQPTTAPVDFISKTNDTLSLGKVGTAYQSQFGAVVYAGHAVQGNCAAGRCDFGAGFNAFFVFQFGAGSTGDGFTFTFFNGEQNNAASVGGYGGMGELMGYAGSSYVSGSYFLDGQGGRGIQPPKVALEFDPYANACGAVCGSGGRCDDTSGTVNQKNHMALLFWGDNTTSCGSLSGSAVGRLTFDDNRHGAGGGSSESFVNARNPSQSPFNACRYFDGNNPCTGPALGWPGNWLLGASAYALRMEVRRQGTPETSGNHRYTITAWIKRCTTSMCMEYADTADFLNTKQDYQPATPDHTLFREIEMSPAYHSRFDKVLFGWTTATGGATQNVTISRFRLNFLK